MPPTKAVGKSTCFSERAEKTSASLKAGMGSRGLPDLSVEPKVEGADGSRSVGPTASFDAARAGDVLRTSPTATPTDTSSAAQRERSYT
ncbi:MAG: hypothetical protein ABI181_12685 [Mycobacteriaceae bacterium]